VPAVHRIEDPTLLAWVRSQAAKGATIVGVCDGVWVLAHAGLLKERQAVGHWYSWGNLGKQFPNTTWVRNTRYLADGKVVTTTGVTASLPVSLAIVEAIAGTEKAHNVARKLGVTSWQPTHQSDRFKLKAGHVFTAAFNWLAFWSHEDVELPLTPGVDEVAIALAADAHARSYKTSVYTSAPSAEPVRSQNGLLIYPDWVGGATRGERLLVVPARTPAAQALDQALGDIERLHGPATARFVALQLEYSRP
jgi:transcriptional regulator GlxA family with amidase domain